MGKLSPSTLAPDPASFGERVKLVRKSADLFGMDIVCRCLTENLVDAPVGAVNGEGG